MADEKKGNIIIVKKIKKAGHGAHGGAWKVAFADFMTAMMAFFLVMWLMGSDEEVKSSVADYFNNPTSAWRPNLQAGDNLPLGRMTGAGEHVLRGSDGNVPEELVDRPSTQHYLQPEETRDDGEIVQDAAMDQIPDVDVTIEQMKFTVAEKILFEPGTSELTAYGEKHLRKLARIIRPHKGALKIKGYTLPEPAHTSSDPYELSISRVVAVMKYMVSKKWIDENRVTPLVGDEYRKPAGGATARVQHGRQLEFVLDHGS